MGVGVGMHESECGWAWACVGGHGLGHGWTLACMDVGGRMWWWVGVAVGGHGLSWACMGVGGRGCGRGGLGRGYGRERELGVVIGMGVKTRFDLFDQLKLK